MRPDVKLEHFTSKASNLFAENRFMRFIVAVMSAALIVNSFMVYRAVKYQRVIIVPAKTTSTIEFIQGRPNDVYVKDLVRDVTSLATTYTPALARSQFAAVLASYAPEAYPAASKAWYSLAGEIEDANTSSVFFIQSIDIKSDTAEVFGSLRQFAGDTPFVNETRTYLVKYRFLDGRFQILSFERKLVEAQKKKL